MSVALVDRLCSVALVCPIHRRSRALQQSCNGPLLESLLWRATTRCGVAATSARLLDRVIKYDLMRTRGGRCRTLDAERRGVHDERNPMTIIRDHASVQAATNRPEPSGVLDT